MKENTERLFYSIGWVIVGLVLLLGFCGVLWGKSWLAAAFWGLLLVAWVHVAWQSRNKTVGLVVLLGLCVLGVVVSLMYRLWVESLFWGGLGVVWVFHAWQFRRGNRAPDNLIRESAKN